MKKYIKLLIAIMLLLSLSLTIFAHAPDIPANHTSVYNWRLLSLEGDAYGGIDWSAHWDYADSPVISTAHVLLYEFDSSFNLTPYSNYKTTIAAGLNSWSGVGGITVREKATGETTDLYLTTYMYDEADAGGAFTNLKEDDSYNGYTTTVNGNNHLTCLSMVFNRRYMDGVAENEPHGHWSEDQAQGVAAHEMGHVFGLADSFYSYNTPGPAVPDTSPNNSLYRVMRPVTFDSGGRKVYEPNQYEEGGAALIVTNSDDTHNSYPLTSIDSVKHANICTCGIYQTSTLANHSFGSWTNNPTEGNHKRTCGCGAHEDAAHTYNNHDASPHNDFVHYLYCDQRSNGCNEYFFADHDYIGQTCTQGGVCVCEKPGSPFGHSWATTYQYNNSQHWYPCTRGCGAFGSQANHSNAYYYYNSFQHKYGCLTCNYVQSTSDHTYGSPQQYNYAMHIRTCSASGCGTNIYQSHSWSYGSHNSSQHYQSCSCGYGAWVDHSGSYCPCGYSPPPGCPPHDCYFVNHYQYTQSTCYIMQYECSNCSYVDNDLTMVGGHSPPPDYSWGDYTCLDCGMTVWG